MDYKTNDKISEDNIKYKCPKCGSTYLCYEQDLNDVQRLYKCKSCNIVSSDINYFKKKTLLNFDRRINIIEH